MMAAVADQQISTNAVSPSAQAEVAEVVRAAYASSDAVYTVGGGTALDFGNSPSRLGQKLDMTGLSKVVDYTPRDMTILVEAGVRMTDLAATLAAEGQQLPIDVPRASEATIGGVVATNWNGPRRYGHGNVRDYVIGIHAVDGRGIAFKGGGRVVKNVAGYDFCKLLTGSLGTLGIITQLAFKVKPQLKCAAAVIADCANLSITEKALDRLAILESPPVAIDLLIGAAWGFESANLNQLVVRVEGTQTEVDYLAERAQGELSGCGCNAVRRVEDAEADTLWERQVEFSDRGAGSGADNSPLVVQISVPPSAVTGTIAQLLVFDDGCTIQAHAASGVIVARFSKFTQGELTTVLVGKLRPAAVQLGGSLTVVRSKLEGLTPHLAWGGRTDAIVLLERIKEKFDPRGILNPGRFVF
jgi:glycolate oxidase FAD binding subunit